MNCRYAEENKSSVRVNVWEGARLIILILPVFIAAQSKSSNSLPQVTISFPSLFSDILSVDGSFTAHYGNCAQLYTWDCSDNESRLTTIGL